MAEQLHYLQLEFGKLATNSTGVAGNTGNVGITRRWNNYQCGNLVGGASESILCFWSWMGIMLNTNR